VSDQATRGAARTAALIAVPIALLAGVLAFWGLGGFNGNAQAGASASPGPQATGSVPMAAPALPDQQATVCRALLAQLPDQIRDRTRRPVSAGPEQNAAYGDPAITLACAPGPAPSIAPTAEVYVLSGVCWYSVSGKQASTWTTVDRQVPVTVTVPASYDAPGQWVTEFSAPIVAAVPSIQNPPTGCTTEG
jgi:hypothetical protein